MALTKMGGVTTAASGKMNGIVYSRNRNGTYVRTFAVPTNPRSMKQTAVRTALGSLATAYKGLSDAQRLGWEQLGLTMTRQNRVGDTYNLTGTQAYVSINQYRITAGDAPVPDAPSQDVLATVNFLTVLVKASDTVASRSLSIIPSITGTGASVNLRVYASPVLSAARKFIRPTQYRLLTSASFDTGTPSSLLADYEATFGNLSANKVGAKLSILVVPYDPEGFAGVPFRMDAIITAGP